MESTAVRKTKLVYKDKSEIVASSPEIDRLKSKANTYFGINAKKFFLSFKGMFGWLGNTFSRYVFVHSEFGFCLGFCKD